MYIGNPFVALDEESDKSSSDVQADVISDFLSMVWPRLRSDPEITEVVQTNIRDGVPLLEHILQGVGFILSLTTLLKVAQDEQWVRRAITAFILHDLNKLRSEHRSLSEIVRDDTAFSHYILRFGLDHFLDVEELPLQALRFMVENASEEHGKRGSVLLGLAPQTAFNPEQYVRDTVPVIQVADIRDLSKTLDERRFKDRVANHLARLTGERVGIIRCRVAEHRGVLTQLIQQACEQCLEEAGAIAGWVYPEGSAYLTVSSTWRGDDLCLLEMIKDRFIKLRKEFFSNNTLKLLQLGKDGLKFPLLLCFLVDPKHLADSVRKRCVESNLAALRKSHNTYRSELNRSQGAPASRRELVSPLTWASAYSGAQ